MADLPVEAAVDASGAGMPQLDLSTFPNQIFWLLVTLGVIYFLLSRSFLPRVGTVLAERKGTIKNDITAAEELKRRALEAEAAYDKALLDARTEAGKIVADTKASIQSKLDLKLQEADAKIAAQTAESEKAIADIQSGAAEAVKTVAKDTAKEIVISFGGKADTSAINAAVSARMKG